ncbi:hypothetical protein BVU17_17910 (plasmid) [Haloarcula taiwanensis]|uniref:Uncharacterized protein n=1 Tax=Haloarcula taiwanensis TaxID=1932004 RepID=A0A2H5A404_9EURY|nr:hypothetical protein BVU17_17910 [Haloarcula taiwanensis]
MTFTSRLDICLPLSQFCFNMTDNSVLRVYIFRMYFRSFSTTNDNMNSCVKRVRILNSRPHMADFQATF